MTNQSAGNKKNDNFDELNHACSPFVFFISGSVSMALELDSGGDGIVTNLSVSETKSISARNRLIQSKRNVCLVPGNLNY